MPFLSTKAIRASSRLALVVSILLIFASGNGYAFSLLSWFPSEGSFGLGQWQGAIIGGYDAEDDQWSSPGTSTTSVVRNRYDEEVYLSNQGFYLIDPRLVYCTAGTDLDFFQETDKTSGVNQHTDGQLIGWDASAAVLGEMPYSGTLFSHRSETINNNGFGARIDSLNQSFGGIALLRQDGFQREVLPYFNAQVYARQLVSDQTTTQLGQSYTVDETRDEAGFDAHKGFQTADLDFSDQFINDSYGGTIPYSFTTNWANLNYGLDFGPTLNRTWNSQVSYLSLSGTGVDQSFLYADDRLEIDHFKNLSTSYEYLLISSDSQSQQDTNNTATFQLTYSPYRNLVNSLTLQGYYETLSQGKREFVAAALSHNYNHPIPWGGTLTLGTDGRYEIDQDDVTGPIPVLYEKHVAPPFFGPGIGFTLNFPFVVTSTIVMYDTRGGARIPTRLGVDYVIVQQGQLTQIVILPTTLVILPNDPLEVSYSYVVAPNGRYSTTTLSANAGVTFDWIALNYAHQQLSQSLQSGVGAQYLFSMHQDSGQLDLHKEWEFFDARGSALYQIFHTQSPSYGSFDYTLQNYGEYLTFRPGWSTTIRADAHELFVDYTHPTRKDEDLDAEISADHNLSSGNFLTAFALARQVSVTLSPTETDYEAGLRGDFRYGKLFFRPSLSWIERAYGPTKVDDARILLRIGRYL